MAKLLETREISRDGVVYVRETYDNKMVIEKLKKTPREKETISRDAFLDLLTNTEMVAIYKLAETDTQAAVFKDLLMAKSTVRKAKVQPGLEYFVAKGLITTERKEELLNW